MIKVNGDLESRQRCNFRGLMVYHRGQHILEDNWEDLLLGWSSYITPQVKRRSADGIGRAVFEYGMSMHELEDKARFVHIYVQSGPFPHKWWRSFSDILVGEWTTPQLLLELDRSY